MANQDDDERDLKQLKQLRQIWLAMPEEEPPTRGLDALMAAARKQAATVQAAPAMSWWRKLLASLVRPPALAMATLVVVIGGAALVGRHQDELESKQVVAGAVSVGAGSAAPTADETPTGDPRELPGPGAPPSADVATPPSEAAKPATPQIVHDAVSRTDKSNLPAKPAVAKKPPSKPDADALAESKIVLAKQPRPAVAKPEPPPKSTSSGGKDGRKGDEGQDQATSFSPADEGNAESVRSEANRRPASPKDATVAPVMPAPVAAHGSVPKPSPSGGAPQLATDGPTESVQALMQRARTAATRGDCATVKSLAATIARRDAAFYRSTTLKDAAVAKCL